MQTIEPLIRTKLHLPSIRPNLVPRPRLQQQIRQGMTGPLTLVVAPAGFGKSTLVASCITDFGLPVAWLSLDKNDNQIGRFLNYLITAVHKAEKSIADESGQLISGIEQLSVEAVLTSLINDLDRAQVEIVLVLDDYQFIGNEAVHEAVVFLLDHCPPGLHIVILTRSDPPLPLSRLRARDQMIELRVADLRFTEQESFQFLNEVMGLQLDFGSVVVLEQRTEGWIAGLQMAALSMRDREDTFEFIEGFSGTNRYILDYLLEEVLARESEEVQSFLLKTSILTRLSGSLCDAVTGSSGGQELLEMLERRNLFIIPLDDNRGWYRYHHLFADLLQARLHRLEPERIARLLSRAAKWCEGEGQVAEAVGYAIAAQDYGMIADLVARHWRQMASTGQVETVWSWLDALPADVIKNNALLGVAYCWVLWLRGQMSEIESHLVDVVHTWNKLITSQGFAKDNPDYASLPAELAILHSFVARYHDDGETARTFAERALSLAPANVPPALNAVLLIASAAAYDAVGDLERAADTYAKAIRMGRLGFSATTVGITYLLIGVLRLLGRLRAADTACRDALEYMQTQGMDRLPAAGILHVAMSEVLLEQNDLESAEAQLAQGLELGKRSGRLDAVRNAAYVRARLSQVRQDSKGALLAVEETDTAHGEFTSPLARADLLAVKATVLVWQGKLDEAAQCIEEAIRLVGHDRGQIREKIALASLRIMVAQCKPEEAIPQLTRSIAAVESSGLLGVALELHILRSLALVQRGATREAEADLECALAIAEPEGYVRTFLDEGEPMQLLISQWLAHTGSSPLRDYAANLLSHFSNEPWGNTLPSTKPSPSNDLIEPLTPRELEVLRLLAAGLSNRQIAAKLYLAEGTVKFYMHTIMGKLGVHSRTQALVIAREQNLL